jgi:hypothetical protein
MSIKEQISIAIGQIENLLGNCDQDEMTEEMAESLELALEHLEEAYKKLETH